MLRLSLTLIACSAPFPLCGQTLETVTVQGERLDASSEESKAYKFDKSESATRLDISPQETPQTLNVVTRQQMADFGLSNAREVLAVTPGVVVQNQETDRTSYGSRGSEISNFQMDGLGIPFEDYNYQNGDIDTFAFDRVEVVKGANGLTSSLGDPGASVNFIRKRPTRRLQSALGLSYGSWNTRRIEGDLSGPLSGAVRGRVTAASESGDSYLDHYQTRKTIVSASVEADLTDSTRLTLGHLQQSNGPRGNNWGALPLLDQDGHQLSYTRSYNPVPDWVKWDRTNQNSFLELQQTLVGNLVVKATLQGNRSDEDAALVYYYGAPDADGNGVSILPALYTVKQRQQLADINLGGRFPLIGREHEFVVGTSWSKNQDKQKSWAADSTPSFNWYDWDGQFDRPGFTFDDEDGSKADFEQKIQTVYAAARLHVADTWKILLGANNTQADSSGQSYGYALDYDKSKTLPYAGLTCTFLPNYTAYSSYTSIFRPQSSVDTEGKLLDPVEGLAYEFGVKGSWLDNALNGSIALFKTEQNDYPVRASDSASIIKQYVVGDLRTGGVEIDVAGKISNHTQVAAGYTQVKMRDNRSGQETRTYLPPRLFTLLLTQEILQGFKAGAGLSWMDKVHQDVEIDDKTGRIRQGDYALVQLMASYEATENLSVQANGGNVTNRQYLNSFPDGQGFYGASAHYSLAVNWKN